MPRKPGVYLHQGWYVSTARSQYTKFCRETEGKEKAERLFAAWLAGKPIDHGPPPATLAEVFARFMSHAKTYYRLPSGKPSSEVRSFSLSWRQLLDAYGSMPAADLRRSHVVAARDAMIHQGISRMVINQSVGRIKRAVRWLVETGHLPDECWASIAVIKNLPPYRSLAPERKPVPPVKDTVFLATVAMLPEPWASIARVQWYTGMRPGEACGLRMSHLSIPAAGSAGGADVWMADFRTDHKMAYKGKKRVVVIGPQAVGILSPWVERAKLHQRDPVFWVRRRHSPVTVSSYAHAVERAAVAAGVEHWHPNQIRHSYGTRVRREFGLDAAQATLGHAKADVTQVYAEVDAGKAEMVARKIG